MKTVVLVSWHFPPTTAVGARRPAQLHAGLAAHGYRSLVVCPHLTPPRAPAHDVIETRRGHIGEWIRQVGGFSDKPLFEQATGVSSHAASTSNQLSRAGLLRQAKNLILPDDMSPWIPLVLRTARRLRHESVDLVLGTSPPFSAAVAAAGLARALNVPFVVDVRDPYTQNASYPPGWLDRPLKERLERRVLDDAARVITASKGFALKQSQLTSTPTTAIYNAYDACDVLANDVDAPGDAPVIAHTGTIYEKTATLQPLVDGLRHLVQAGQRPRLVNCGKNGAVLRTHLDAAGLSDVLDDRGVVSREEAARIRAQAHGLLVFLPSRGADDGHVPAKLFDYLGSGKPVLACGTPSTEPAQLLASTPWVVCTTADDVVGFFGRLDEHVRQGPRPDRRFSAASMCAQFAAVFDDLLA